MEQVATDASPNQAEKVSEGKGRTKNFRSRRGSRKGVPNKTTVDVRKAIALIAEKNVKKLDAWLTRIGRNDPARAADIFLRMLEYHIPKLTRAEIVQEDKRTGRVIDSSQLTAEQREQLRQMILAQAEPALLEQQPANVLEPVGLVDAQVIDSVEDTDCRTSVMGGDT